eukprot:288545_1
MDRNDELRRIYELNKSKTMELDLTESDHHQWAYQMADILLQSKELKHVSDMNKLETFIMKKHDPKLTTVSFHLSVRLSRSKLKMMEIDAQKKRIYVTYIFPVYKETQRIKPKAEYRNGEQFLYQKVRQILWIFKGCTYVKWRMIIVDDGCPDQSGKVIENKLNHDKMYSGLDIKVIYLQTVINNKEYEVFADLKSTKDSQKGGAVHYGLYYAAHNEPECDEDVICMTDADLSADLGITGLLLHNYLCNKYKYGIKMAIAERYDNRIGRNSLYCTKIGASHLFGFDMVNLALRTYFRSCLLPSIAHIVDTQCGFKFIGAGVVKEIIHKLKDRSFTIDIELMLTIYQHYKDESATKLICSESIVWIESVAESAFWSEVGSGVSEDSAKSYFKMIQNMVALHDTWFKNTYTLDERQMEMIEYIRKLSFEEYFKITQFIFENTKD